MKPRVVRDGDNQQCALALLQNENLVTVQVGFGSKLLKTLV